MRRPAVAVLTAVLAAVLAGVALPATAQTWTPAGYAARLLTLMNGARADAGLPALSQAAGTTTVAAGWTHHLASTRTLAHNPDLGDQLETHGSADWTTYGENVGTGDARDPGQLFRAYMSSPEHRANILAADYRFVGVAVEFTGKGAWNTVDFVDAYGDGSTTGAATGGSHVSAPRPSHPAAQPARTAVRAAPAPTAAASTAPAAPTRSTATHHRAAHHHTAAHPRKAAPARIPQVRALRRPWSEPLAAAHPTGGQPDVTLDALAGSGTDRRGRAVAVALAVLLLGAAARRWTLTCAAAPRRVASLRTA